MRKILLPQRSEGDPSLVRWPRLAGEPLSWDIQSFNNAKVVVVEGELDVGTAPSLAGHIGPLADEGSHLILDMSGVRFCDCAGLSLFLRLKKHAVTAGGSLHLAALTTPVRRLVRLARLDEVLPVTTTVADVLAELDQAS
jgi:anti-sigma B factor antagonist